MFAINSMKNRGIIILIIIVVTELVASMADAACTPCGSCDDGDYCYSVCTNCPQGYKCKSCGITACLAGSFQPNTGQSTCITCPAGNKCPGTANINADPCGLGYYQPNTGQSTCITCPAGSWCPSSTTINPSDCPAGKFSGTTGETSSSTCASCTAGRCCTSTGMTAAGPLCAAGYYCPSGCATPTPCLAGTFRSTTGGVAQSSCSPCPAGYYCPSPAINPTACPSGSYRSTQSGTALGSCTPCPAGYYCPSPAINPTACASGSYRSPTGGVAQSSCTPCPAAYFCTSPAINPTACAGGSYRSSTGGTSQSSCTPCPVGTYCPSPATTPTNCGVGYQNPSSASPSFSSCTQCAPGRYNDQPAVASCAYCSAGTANPNTGSTASTACVNCLPGNWSPLGSSSCTACALGSASNVVARPTACPSCVAGTYAASTGMTACTLCGYHKYSTAIGASSPNTCIWCGYRMRTYIQGANSFTQCYTRTFSVTSELTATQSLTHSLTADPTTSISSSQSTTESQSQTQTSSSSSSSSSTETQSVSISASQTETESSSVSESPSASFTVSPSETQSLSVSESLTRPSPSISLTEPTPSRGKGAGGVATQSLSESRDSRTRPSGTSTPSDTPSRSYSATESNSSSLTDSIEVFPPWPGPTLAQAATIGTMTVLGGMVNSAAAIRSLTILTFTQKLCTEEGKPEAPPQLNFPQTTIPGFVVPTRNEKGFLWRDIRRDRNAKVVLVSLPQHRGAAIAGVFVFPLLVVLLCLAGTILLQSAGGKIKKLVVAAWKKRKKEQNKLNKNKLKKNDATGEKIKTGNDEDSDDVDDAEENSILMELVIRGVLVGRFFQAVGFALEGVIASSIYVMIEKENDPAMDIPIGVICLLSLLCIVGYSFWLVKQTLNRYQMRFVTAVVEKRKTKLLTKKDGKASNDNTNNSSFMNPVNNNNSSIANNSNINTNNNNNFAEEDKFADAAVKEGIVVKFWKLVVGKGVWSPTTPHKVLLSDEESNYLQRASNATHNNNISMYALDEIDRKKHRRRELLQRLVKAAIEAKKQKRLKMIEKQERKRKREEMLAMKKKSSNPTEIASATSATTAERDNDLVAALLLVPTTVEDTGFEFAALERLLNDSELDNSAMLASADRIDLDEEQYLDDNPHKLLEYLKYQQRIMQKRKLPVNKKFEAELQSTISMLDEIVCSQPNVEEELLESLDRDWRKSISPLFAKFGFVKQHWKPEDVREDIDVVLDEEDHEIANNEKQQQERQEVPEEIVSPRQESDTNNDENNTTEESLPLLVTAATITTSSSTCDVIKLVESKPADSSKTPTTQKVTRRPTSSTSVDQHQPEMSVSPAEATSATLERCRMWLVENTFFIDAALTGLLAVVRGLLIAMPCSWDNWIILAAVVTGLCLVMILVARPQNSDIRFMCELLGSAIVFTAVLILLVGDESVHDTVGNFLLSSITLVTVGSFGATCLMFFRTKVQKYELLPKSVFIKHIARRQLRQVKKKNLEQNDNDDHDINNNRDGDDNFFDALMAGHDNSSSDSDDELERLVNNESVVTNQNGAQTFDIMEMLKQDLENNNNNNRTEEIDLDFDNDLMAFLVPNDNPDDLMEQDEDIAPLKIDWNDFLTEHRDNNAGNDDEYDENDYDDDDDRQEEEDARTVKEQGGELPKSSSSSNLRKLGVEDTSKPGYESDLAQKRKMAKILDELEELDDKALAEKRRQDELKKAKTSITDAQALRKRMNSMYGKK